MKRFGQTIKIKPEKLEQYKKLHANPWPEILQKIEACNIKNFSIFLLEEHTLFAYFEYIGTNFEADMERMAADEATQRWWKETDPCQESFSITPGEWWHNMEELFHCD